MFITASFRFIIAMGNTISICKYLDESFVLIAVNESDTICNKYLYKEFCYRCGWS